MYLIPIVTVKYRDVFIFVFPHGYPISFPDRVFDRFCEMCQFHEVLSSHEKVLICGHSSGCILLQQFGNYLIGKYPIDNVFLVGSGARKWVTNPSIVKRVESAYKGRYTFFGNAGLVKGVPEYDYHLNLNMAGNPSENEVAFKTQCVNLTTDILNRSMFPTKDGRTRDLHMWRECEFVLGSSNNYASYFDGILKYIRKYTKESELFQL